MISLEQLPPISATAGRQTRLLVLAPNCDGTDVGEAWRAFKWVKSMEGTLDITLLTLQRKDRVAVEDQFDDVNVVSWPEPEVGSERFTAMLKPAYLHYFRLVRKFLRSARASGQRFDVAHQLTPAALRYPSPLVGQGIPYILGPLAGSLRTPEHFKHECGNAPWYTRLRELDHLRFQYDPLLRRSYEEAAMVIGVAPYVKELLGSMNLKRFVLHREMAIDELAPLPVHRPLTPGTLNLLHVGRGVRTKGLRDVVRALARLDDLPNVRLHSAGNGEEIGFCKREAKRLGVEDRIVFHGQLARQDVERLYATSDLFVFPSFREPCGRVLSESMRWGLPVLTVKVGGPGYVVNNRCGITVDAATPDQLATDLAARIRELALNPFLLVPLRDGARDLVSAEGLWCNKADMMRNAYRHVIAESVTEEAAA